MDNDQKDNNEYVCRVQASFYPKLPLGKGFITKKDSQIEGRRSWRDEETSNDELETDWKNFQRFSEYIKAEMDKAEKSDKQKFCEEELSVKYCDQQGDGLWTIMNN